MSGTDAEWAFRGITPDQGYIDYRRSTGMPFDGRMTLNDGPQIPENILSYPQWQALQSYTGWQQPQAVMPTAAPAPQTQVQDPGAFAPALPPSAGFGQRFAAGPAAPAGFAAKGLLDPAALYLPQGRS